MGVCCIVFDIDGMLLEFFMNFLNIGKIIFFFQYFMFSSHFMGGGVEFFFLEKQLFLISRFMLFSTFKKIETPRLSITFSLLVKWEVVSLVVDRDSWNLYPLYPLFPCSDIVSQMWGWFGGGGCNVFLKFYAISNISRNKIWEYKTIISHLMFSSCFFVCWKY